MFKTLFIIIDYKYKCVKVHQGDQNFPPKAQWNQNGKYFSFLVIVEFQIRHICVVWVCSLLQCWCCESWDSEGEKAGGVCWWPQLRRRDRQPCDISQYLRMRRKIKYLCLCAFLWISGSLYLLHNSKTSQVRILRLRL